MLEESWLLAPRALKPDFLYLRILTLRFLVICRRGASSPGVVIRKDGAPAS